MCKKGHSRFRVINVLCARFDLFVLVNVQRCSRSSASCCSFLHLIEPNLAARCFLCARTSGWPDPHSHDFVEHLCMHVPHQM